MKESGSISEYKLLEKIGCTRNEIIYKALFTKTQQFVAIKSIFIGEYTKDIASLSKLPLCNHRNLLQYYNYFYNSQEGCLIIIMELCSGSFGQIIHRFRPLNEKEISAVFRKVLEGLICFSSGNLNNTTNNINAHNIFFDSNNEIKISQFLTNGLFRNKHNDPFENFWVSPEKIKGKLPSDSRRDIWSLGITAIELLTGNSPYINEHIQKPSYFLIKRIFEGQPPNPPADSSPEFKAFVSKCLIKNISERPTAKELINDPFITSVSESEGKKLIDDLIQSYIENKHNFEEEEEEEEEEEYEKIEI